MIIDRNAVTQEVPIDPETGKPYLNTVAAIQVSANGVGSEVSPYVAQAVEVIRESGLPQETNALFTNVEGDLDDVLKVAGEAAKKLAERKAGAVIQEVLSENYTGMLIVIGADTMVVLDGKIFGKPRSASDGKHMLRSLSGRTHEVITAVSVWRILRAGRHWPIPAQGRVLRQGRCLRHPRRGGVAGGSLRRLPRHYHRPASDAPHQGIPRPRERRGRRMLSDQFWLSLAVA